LDNSHLERTYSSEGKGCLGGNPIKMEGETKGPTISKMNLFVLKPRKRTGLWGGKISNGKSRISEKRGSDGFRNWGGTVGIRVSGHSRKGSWGDKREKLRS